MVKAETYRGYLHEHLADELRRLEGLRQEMFENNLAEEKVKAEAEKTKKTFYRLFMELDESENEEAPEPAKELIGIVKDLLEEDGMGETKQNFDLGTTWKSSLEEDDDWWKAGKKDEEE